MAVITRVTDIEKLPNWETHVGPDVAGQPDPPLPTKTGWADRTGWREFFMEGPAWVNVLYANHLPLQPNTGFCTLKYDFMVDGSAALAQCYEIDTRFQIAGYNYNHSLQFNQSLDGMIQISDNSVPVGKWKDTGFKIGRFVPGQVYPISISYFHTKDRKYCTTGISVGDKTYSPAQQWLDAQPLNWAEGCHLQFQLDLAGVAGKMSAFARDMTYVWY